MPYWKPEQPPPETEMRRNASDVPSVRITSAMRRAALSGLLLAWVALPILIAIARGDAEERAFWRRTLEDGDQGPGDLENAIRMVERRDPELASRIGMATTRS